MCPHPAASLITLTSSTRFRPDAYLETHFLQKLWTVQDHYPTLLFNGADGALVTGYSQSG